MCVCIYVYTYIYICIEILPHTNICKSLWDTFEQNTPLWMENKLQKIKSCFSLSGAGRSLLKDE